MVTQFDRNAYAVLSVSVWVTDMTRKGRRAGPRCGLCGGQTHRLYIQTGRQFRGAFDLWICPIQHHVVDAQGRSVDLEYHIVSEKQGVYRI